MAITFPYSELAALNGKVDMSNDNLARAGKLADMVRVQIEKVTGKWTAAEVTFYLAGNGLTSLKLPFPSISAVSAVTVLNDADDEDVLDGVVFNAHVSKIYHEDTFPAASGYPIDGRNIKVDCTIGYADTAELRAAHPEWVDYWVELVSLRMDIRQKAQNDGKAIRVNQPTYDELFETYFPPTDEVVYFA